MLTLVTAYDDLPRQIHDLTSFITFPNSALGVIAATLDLAAANPAVVGLATLMPRHFKPLIAVVVPLVENRRHTKA
jgi:hypothetical protein